MHPKTGYKFCKFCKNPARDTPPRGVYIPYFDQISVKISVLGVLYPNRCTDGGWNLELCAKCQTSPTSVQRVHKCSLLLQTMSVGLSVCHSSEPCKNCWTDHDAVGLWTRVGSRKYYYMGCTMHVGTTWRITHVWWRCGLLSNYFEKFNLFIFAVDNAAAEVTGGAWSPVSVDKKPVIWAGPDFAQWQVSWSNHLHKFLG